MSTMITEGSVVTLHFSIFLQDGSVADSSKVNDHPGTLTIGDGTLTSGMEKHLLGLKKGETKRFTIPPEDAFGVKDSNQERVLPQARFPAAMKLEPGMIIEFTTPEGYIRPGVIKEISEVGVLVDFNHLLAGQVITFEVEILEVQNEVVAIPV